MQTILKSNHPRRNTKWHGKPIHTLNPYMPDRLIYTTPIPLAKAIKTQRHGKKIIETIDKTSIPKTSTFITTDCRSLDKQSRKRQLDMVLSRGEPATIQKIWTILEII